MEWNTFFLVILIIIIKSTTSQITQRPPVENISTYHADWDTPLYTHPSNCRKDSFVPIRPAQLRCPHEFEDINKGLVSVPTQIIHLPLSVTSVSAVASGHYLHRVTYRVTCSTGFLEDKPLRRPSWKQSCPVKRPPMRPARITSTRSSPNLPASG